MHKVVHFVHTDRITTVVLLVYAVVYTHESLISAHLDGGGEAVGGAQGARDLGHADVVRLFSIHVTYNKYCT
jgi:hypothetical protein